MIMSETAGAFLALGVIFSGVLMFGLASGRMLGKFTIDDRINQPGFYWATAVGNGLLALSCFFAAWASW